jgi:hypothetical protein
MNTKFAVVARLIFVLFLVFGIPSRMRAQDGKAKYPSMAPFEQYLIPIRDAEIALARSAAPDSISRDAKILVLGRHGYETAVEGKNGFVCIVERAWMSPFESAEFWNPKIRGPLCYNPPAVQSILPFDYKRTELALAGQSKAQISDWMKAAAAKKELPEVEAGAMCYMLSKEAYLTDADDHNMAHLMFYTPHTDGKNWGADLPNSPVMVGEQGPPQPYTLFLVAVGKWSDGTAAPLP